MPFTSSVSEEASPYKLALPAAYTKITNLQCMCAVNPDGTAAEPVWTIFTAVYANEAAYKAGGSPGAQNNFQITLGSPVMPLFEAALKPVLAALSGVTNVTQIES